MLGGQAFPSADVNFVHTKSLTYPSLTQVLVGFADKLRLMSVLMEDLKTIKELGIKVCNDLSLSLSLSHTNTHSF